MKKVLVCGSIALDLIGKYPGSFADYQDKYRVSALNISLQLASLHTSFGGCGMNIAYGLKKFGVECIPVSAAGRNFRDHYEAHLTRLGIDVENIVVDENFEACATAVMVSDRLGNQITAFHPGASVSPKRRLPSAVEGIDEVAMAVLAPEDAPVMLRQARDLHALGIPIMFDPGQGLAEFRSDEAMELLERCHYVIVNTHEWDILQRVTRASAGEIIDIMDQVIVTRGDQGVQVYAKDLEPIDVGGVVADLTVDPTGCGDAFRAGYVAGLIEGHEPAHCARMGCLAAVYNLESHETQRYDFDRSAFARRFEECWGYPLP